MAQAGLPDFVVDLYSEMFLAMKEGRIAPEQPRTPETTTPTGLVQFARPPGFETGCRGSCLEHQGPVSRH